MERMTKRRIDDGEAYLACVELPENECDGICTTCWRAGEAVDKLAAYEDTGLTPEEIKSAITKDALIKLTAQALETTPERLRELAAADKKGRVVVLPCKVGDRLYEVTGRKTISVYEVRAIRVELFGLFIEWDIVEGFVWQSLSGIKAGEIGKTVFLTREEAEKVLQEMEGKE